jgi:hypothetical protein
VIEVDALGADHRPELDRKRSIAAYVQKALENIYRIERVVDVRDFLHNPVAGERESLLLRENTDGVLEVGVRLPGLEGHAGLDTLCQFIEGVSHFVYVVERARMCRSTTQLELELQAEVDKWVVLAASLGTLDVCSSARLRARLYEQVTFAHQGDSELGHRYRVANDAANHFVRRLERDYLRPSRFKDMQAYLGRFFRLGQEDKLRLGRAA